MPKRLSINDTLIGETVTADDGRTGYVLTVSTGSGATSQQVQGNVAGAATDAGSPVKVGAVYNSTQPTYTNGQRTDLQSDTRGNVKAVIYGADSVVSPTVSATISRASGPGTSFFVRSIPVLFNGTTYDQQTKANIFSRVASSAASGNPAVSKASAGEVMQFWGQNGAAITYLQIYNKATAPVIGTDTPVLTYPIPANATFTQTLPNAGAYFGTGIAYAFTTDAAGTTGAAAAAVTSFNLLVA